MYGKHFDSMYSGSMVGKGFAAFSLMGYVIANMKPDKTVGFQVDLNRPILAVIFGEPEERIQEAIDFLCAADPESRTPAEDGRRLVQVGKFSYRVVNGLLYDRIRNEEDRREQNRLAQQRHRDKKSGRKKVIVRTMPAIGTIPDGGAARTARMEDKISVENGSV